MCKGFTYTVLSSHDLGRNIRSTRGVQTWITTIIPVEITMQHWQRNLSMTLNTGALYYYQICDVVMFKLLNLPQCPNCPNVTVNKWQKSFRWLHSVLTLDAEIYRESVTWTSFHFCWWTPLLSCIIVWASHPTCKEGLVLGAKGRSRHIYIFFYFWNRKQRDDMMQDYQNIASMFTDRITISLGFYFSCMCW